MAQQRAQYAKQQREIGQMEDFVRRFRAKATKARQAQSRLKALERMETVAPAHVDSPFCFQFPEPGKSSDPLLTIDNLVLGYGDDIVLDGVSLSLHPGDRIGLLGKNGAGKSTFLKGLTGALPALSGDRITGAHLRIGYFDQQQLEVLDLQASALLHLQRLSPKVREQAILDFLGGFNFKGDRARQEIAPFSGGEKARLALAMVVWQDPNVLILDEPTNHLDLEMRHALAVALQGYTGAIVLVSHDRHLMRHAVESLWLVDNGAVTEYPDDLTAYEQWVLSGDRTAAVTPSKTANKTVLTQDSSGKGKQNRQGAAEQRARLRPLQKALEKTERTLEGLQQKLNELQVQLANSELYEPGQQAQLAKLVEAEGLLKSQLSQIEETWMQQQETIESASR
jgi:ATP-binding cassette subfamily F protein 3